MEVETVENRVAAELEKALEEFDRVILVDRLKLDPEFMDRFLVPETFGKVQKKILVLSEAEDKKQGCIVWRCIAGGDLEKMLRVYFMYEFSDRISLISKEHVFGGLLNLVATGILTLEEALAAYLS